jgi:SWIM zinc finger
MQIPLGQFEQYIDETILKRGLDYFKQGLVNPIEEISQGKYETTVEGTEDYTVQLQIQNNTITGYSCSCPYDLGPICKHVVAVIFYMQQEELQLQKSTGNKKQGERNIKKKKTVSEQVNELLENISEEELKEFIRKNTEQNPSFRNIFFSSFAHHNKNESQELYGKQIKAILRTAAGRDGFIDYSTAHSVEQNINPYLDTAQEHIENKNYLSAIFICCAVMEQLCGALQYSDDSNGEIGGPIDAAYERLQNIASKNLSEDVRKQLFSYCIGAFNKNTYSGWDWHLGMLEIASKIISNEKEATTILSLLEGVKSSEYQREKAHEINLQVIRKIRGEKEAEKFLYVNISIPSFREEAIQKNMAEKNFEKAISLAHEGIQQDEKNKPGLANEWRDWLLKIAVIQKDKNKIIHYARLLFVNSIHEKKEYFNLLKQNVAANDWEIFIENVIHDLSNNNRWGNFHQIAEIYISEQWWDRLLSHLQQNNASLSQIEYYEKYLASIFPNELADLYQTGIIKLLEEHADRKHYKEACRYMRKMLKLGAKEKVEQMVAKFRTQYFQRRALMEELGRI